LTRRPIGVTYSFMTQNNAGIGALRIRIVRPVSVKLGV
jgi:hypothetical protein